MKQLSLLAAVLVASACHEAPTAPGTDASPSAVVHVERRGAGLVEACALSAPSIVWTFTATVSSIIPPTSPPPITPPLPSVGAVSDGASMEFCSVAPSVTGEIAPVAVSGVPLLSFDDYATISTSGDSVQVIADGSLFTLRVGNSSYPVLPVTPGTFGSLQVRSQGYTVLFALSVPPVPPPAPTDPTTKDDCKKDGWLSYGFKNQGQCVRFVETGKDSRG